MDQFQSASRKRTSWAQAIGSANSRRLQWKNWPNDLQPNNDADQRHPFEVLLASLLAYSSASSSPEERAKRKGRVSDGELAELGGKFRALIG